jgi:signal transduction histidine kinase
MSSAADSPNFDTPTKAGVSANGNTFSSVARYLRRDSKRILDEWWVAIKQASPSFAELEKMRNPILYHEQSLDLIIKALEARTRAEQDALLEQVTRMAREMAGERLRQGFILKDILLSLAVFRSAVLDAVGRMSSNRMWVSFPVNVLQMEKRINEAMDMQVAAVAEAYMNARDAVIRHREEMLRFHNYQLVKLNDLATRMGESLNMITVLNSASEALREMAELAATAVAIRDEKTEDMWVQPDYGHSGCSLEIIEWLNSPVFKTLGDTIFDDNRPLNVINLADDARFANAAIFGITSLLCVPLRSADKTIGVLYGIDYIAREFSPHEVNLILTFANQAALAAENARLFTQLQVAYEELQELDKVKDDFVSIASHEIRTPLTLVKGYSSTLLRPDLNLPPEKRQKFIVGIDDACNRLINLIDNLLSVSRIESGRFRINAQPVNIKEVINHAVAGFQGQLGNHTLELELSDDETRARCNRDQFEQVVNNLISNAIKYSPGGAIKVTTRKLNDGLTSQIEFRVSDQGIGISGEHISKIFDKFYRAETGLTRKTQGTGLGLYICKSIINSYNGEIWAESKPSEGTTFVVTLPVWRNETD